MIAPLDKTHIEQVADIERLCFSEPWSEKAIADSLDSPYSHFYVYLENDAVIGYMGLYAVAGEGSVTNVATHPEHRKKGVGKALVDNAVRLGGKLDLDYITLEVRQSNASAISLYKKCGFEEVGVRKNFYSHPKEDAVIMNYFYNKE